MMMQLGPKMRPEMMSPHPQHLPYPYQKRMVVETGFGDQPIRPQTAPEKLSNIESLRGNVVSFEIVEERIPTAPAQRFNNFFESQGSLHERSTINFASEGDDFFSSVQRSDPSFETPLDPELSWLLDSAPRPTVASLGMDAPQISKRWLSPHPIREASPELNTSPPLEQQQAEQGGTFDEMDLDTESMTLKISELVSSLGLDVSAPSGEELDADGNPVKKTRRKSSKYYSWFGERRRSITSTHSSPKNKSPSPPKTPKTPSQDFEDDGALAAFLPAASISTDSHDAGSSSRYSSSNRLQSTTGSSRPATAPEPAVSPLQAWTKGTFEGRSTQSPYVDHLKTANKLQGLYSTLDIHKAVFSSGNPAQGGKKTAVESVKMLLSRSDQYELSRGRAAKDLAHKKAQLSVYTKVSRSRFQESPKALRGRLPVIQVAPPPATHESRPVSTSSRPGQASSAPLPQVVQTPPVAQQPDNIALDMVVTSHLDPLYRIVREEVERLRPGTGGVVAETQRVSAGDIKMLSCFQSLPPAVWVTCRIVYFVLVAYHESIVSRREFTEYRRLQRLEGIWGIIDRHVQMEGVTSETAAREFSWTLLQELMRAPLLFVKALDMVEKGVRLSDGQWAELHAMIREKQGERDGESSQTQTAPRGILLAGSIAGSVATDAPSPLLDVTSNEASRQLFFDQFPVAAVPLLRDLVKAGRGALLAGSSSLHTKLVRPAQNSVEIYSSGQSHVPGSPLAVSVSLVAWLKRIIAAVYSSSIQRQMAASSASAEPPCLRSRPVSRQGGDTSSSGTAKDRCATPKARLPPGLTCATVVNHFQYAQAFERMPAFVHFLLSMIRPCDRLDLLLLSDSHSPDRQVDALAMQTALEQHLRVTSASPLHKVTLVNATPPPGAAADHTDHAEHELGAHNQLDRPHQPHSVDPVHLFNRHAAFLHPGLAHCLYGNRYQLAAPPAHPQHHSAGGGPLDFFLTELHLTQPQCFVYREFLRQRHPPEQARIIEQSIRQSLSFSLALLNPRDQIAAPTNAWASHPSVALPGVDSALRGHRYVVCVTDSPNSWAAFQMTCRLAKESDVIIALHVPCASHLVGGNTDYFQRLASATQTGDEPPAATANPSASRPTAAMLKALNAAAVRRREQVVAHYRELGYNTYCADATNSAHGSIDAIVLASTIYADHVAYAAQLSATLGNADLDPFVATAEGSSGEVMDSCPFYQYNQQLRALARDLLGAALALSPDFLVLGGDADDVFDVLSATNFDATWGFAPIPWLLRDQTPRMLAPAQAQAQAQTSRVMLSAATSVYIGADDDDGATDDYGEDEDFVCADPPQGGGGGGGEEDSFIVEDNEGEHSLALPSPGIPAMELDPALRRQLNEYHEQRRLHFEHFLAFSSTKARLPAMLLHELRFINTWLPAHLEASAAAVGAKTMVRQALERDPGMSLTVEPDFSVLLVNNHCAVPAPARATVTTNAEAKRKN